ncbi:GNAT family N-acetyltransferase [bacterium]|nr:MAG: GNAT family N-acetyltransferase [bacterium]
MTGTKPPFSHEVKYLSNCTLLPMHKKSAEILGVELGAMDPWRSLGYSAKRLEEYLLREDPSLHRFEVHTGKELAGVICVRYPWLRGPYLELIALTGSHRNFGVGKTLLEWFEAGAKTHGQNAWVIVTHFNEGARRFYARHGYQEIASLKGLVTEGVDEILLRKKISG